MLPRIRIANLPTPLEHLPRLSASLQGPQIWVKRDDQTGLAFGGNKTRKLEYLIAAAQADGAKTLITAGAAHSNHCRQTAAAAARFGFHCILVLTDAGLVSKIPLNKDNPQLSFNPADQNIHITGNLLLDHIFGAEIVWASGSMRDEVLQTTFQHARNNGKKPYLIPYGGSNQIGAVAYMYAMNEILIQWHGMTGDGSHPDWIVIPSSSGGTQAGLSVGAKVYQYRGNLLGISVDESAEILRKRIVSLANATADYIREQTVIDQEDVLVNDEFLGGGYGVWGEGEREAITLFARKEGLLLDPVYTSRAATGLLNLIRRGYIKQGERVVFWHTGGTPSIFADQYRLV